MSTTMQVAAPDDAAMMAQAIDSFVTRGDWSALTPKARALAYVNVCTGLGLNPASMPLSFLRLNGKDVLYVGRGATDQLAARHKLNREIVDGPKIVDINGTKIALAVCKATLPGGRFETATATLPIQDPPNLFMKLETKAKRRATLSVLGLGIMDESEVDNIPAKDRGEPLTVVDPELVRAQLAAPTATATATAMPTEVQPTAAPTDEEPADGVVSSEEAPSSRGFAAFIEKIGTAATLVVVSTLYQALLADLHKEGNEPAEFCDGDDGAGALARKRMVALGHRLSKAEGAQVLMAVALAEVIDDQRDIAPGPDALQTAARWWITHRARMAGLEQAHRTTPWYALVRRYAAAADATATKRAGAALEAAVKALDKTPPPTGTDGGRGGSGSSSAAVGTAVSSAPTAGATAMLEQFREHLHAKPRDARNVTRELSEIANSYLKRLQQFKHAGVQRQALDLTRAELRARGCEEPDAILQGVSQQVYGRAV